MIVKYSGTDPLLEGKSFELQGGVAWTPQRFEVLKTMNPRGKVVVVEEQGDKHLVVIGDLTTEPVWRGY